MELYDESERTYSNRAITSSGRHMTVPFADETFCTTDTPARQGQLGVWRPLLLSSLESLRHLAGATESEFLQIGEQMQGVYLRSAEISQLANHLVELASGQRMQELLQGLRRMMDNMDAYLSQSRLRRGERCATLDEVQRLLRLVAKPLEGFQKMNMTLHMLGISIKIESSRLGKKGSGFVNLALDVEKLSHQVNDKSSAILEHRKVLAAMISENMAAVHDTVSGHDAEAALTFNNTAANLHELEAVNQRFIELGGKVSAIAGGITKDIGEVVTSLQFHDITRQQVEHVIEALERLAGHLSSVDEQTLDEARCRDLILESGDVCELQEAQLNFATSELYTAVTTIVDNLRDVASQQTAMGQETLATSGVLEASDSSFIDGIRRGMSSVTELLTACADTDHKLSGIMRRVTSTVGQITSFVTDIEGIGIKIVQIALNAQIKATKTGRRGAALGVLAEAIRHLSDETVQKTDAVTLTLAEVNAASAHLSLDASDDEAVLCARLQDMEGELGAILRMLASMNEELLASLADLQTRVKSLAEEVERVTAAIDVHERCQARADQVLDVLSRIVGQARELEPASHEFKEDLRRMAEHYTMESERRIHEAIRRKHGGHAEAEPGAEEPMPLDVSGGDSEFGDNVDLF